MKGEICALAFFAIGCGTAPAPGAPSDAGTAGPREADAAALVPYPDPDWPTGDPSEAGFDISGLNAAASYSEQNGGRCLLVIQDGKLIYERYFSGADDATQHRTWSIAKSFSSALIGVAIARGDIAGVHEPIATYVEAWQGTGREAITIEHVLSMTSGLSFSLVGDNSWTYLSSDQTRDAVDTELESPPGTVWNYSNRAVQILDAVIESATGRDPEDYAREFLWDRIGMGPGTRWERDRSGNATMYMSVYATCRDLARLGYLYLHGGRWSDGALVDPAHVEASTRYSQDHNRGYGYLWWVNGSEPAFSATGDEYDGPLIPDAPDDLFSAQGLGQNFIDVIPSRGTIFVHTRPAPIDPLSQFVTDPNGTMQKIIEDQQRQLHRELVNLLLGAASK